MSPKKTEDGNWSWTAAPAIPRDDGSVLVKLLAYDGEFPISYVYEHKSVQSEPVLAYEVDTWLSDLWMTQGGTLYLPGEEGHFHVRSRGKWNVSQSPVEGVLTAAWGPNESACYVTTEGAVLRYENRQWDILTSGHSGYLDSIRGTPDGKTLYAAGRAGLLLSYDGKDWKREAIPTNVDLNGLCVTENGLVYAVGDNGVILVGSPGRWTLLEAGIDDHIDVVQFLGGIYVGSRETGVHKLVGSSLVPVLKNVAALRIRTCRNYMCASGAMSFHRFDGSSWTTRQYSL